MNNNNKMSQTIIVEKLAVIRINKNRKNFTFLDVQVAMYFYKVMIRKNMDIFQKRFINRQFSRIKSLLVKLMVRN
jgi:hypothetical protein